MRKLIATSVLAVFIAGFGLVACQKKEEPKPAPAAVQAPSTSKTAPAAVPAAAPVKK